MHLKTESMDRLFDTIVNLNTKEECRAYLEDLCTVKELQDMAQRLDTAVLLSRGFSYKKIMEQVDVSTATIGRVSKCLNYGTGGYRSAIDKLETGEETPCTCSRWSWILRNRSCSASGDCTAAMATPGSR